MASDKSKTLILCLIVLTSFVVIFSLDPIAQDASYHQFADQRQLLGIPHFWNTISNLPFILVGLHGLVFTRNLAPPNPLAKLRALLLIFYGAITLVGLGSGYYHLAPENGTLVWDRLPMTIGFAALFSVIWAESISLRAANLMAGPLVLFGILSVLYWHYTESLGYGDLRPYAAVQFIPMIVIPVLFLLYPSTTGVRWGFWWLLACYALAKLLEHFDQAIYQIANVISGHSLKHIVAALGVYLLSCYFVSRQDHRASKPVVNR